MSSTRRQLFVLFALLGSGPALLIFSLGAGRTGALVALATLGMWATLVGVSEEEYAASFPGGQLTLFRRLLLGAAVVSAAVAIVTYFFWPAGRS